MGADDRTGRKTSSLTKGSRAAPNRLGSTTSPYLLQHQFNPVDWHPWGEGAFAEARRRDVPIFLSIGYSTCYWCHVMERESFEDEQIAARMNELFVCVKVDREERPDVDDLYMAAVQAFTQRGGWPMSVFLEPVSLKPFFAGTYFPAQAKYSNVPSFPQVLDALSSAYQTQRLDVSEQAHQLAEAVRERLAEPTASVRIGERDISLAVVQLLKLHDSAHGGFGPAPKFPQPMTLELLLDAREVASDDETRAGIDASVRLTLDRMALGGLFDQVGGGFHRYSVDAQWLVPHFEKMLYDNAQLATLYARAAVVYSDSFYARIAERTCEYVMREMTSPCPALGLFSAQDAEVNHREGQNYLWTPEQALAALSSMPPLAADRVLSLLGLSAGTNFQDPHHPNEPASNVLWLRNRPSENDQLLLDHALPLLLIARAKREQPSTDFKIIASWNGLMLAALANCSIDLNRPALLKAATEIGNALLDRMSLPSGDLNRMLHTNAVAIGGFLEDYAMFAHGLIAVHRAVHRASAISGTVSPPSTAPIPKHTRWLDAAIALVARAELAFTDPMGGAFFDTRNDQPDLFCRGQSPFDGALPSGISIMLSNLLDLWELTGKQEYLDRAMRCLVGVSGVVSRSPIGAAGSLRSLLRVLRNEPVRFREALERAVATSSMGTAAPHSTPAPLTPSEFTPVEILASQQSVVLTLDEPASLPLHIRIAPEYHIAAADPGDSQAAHSLVPMSVRIINGAGVNVYADYPPGELLGPSDQPERQIRVYRGEFELVLAIERSGDWKGRPLIGISFQACTDTSCMQPTTVELDIAIDRA